MRNISLLALVAVVIALLTGMGWAQSTADAPPPATVAPQQPIAPRPPAAEAPVAIPPALSAPLTADAPPTGPAPAVTAPAPPPVAPASAPAPAPPGSAPALAASEAQRLATLLRDEAKRAELLATLDALARVAPTPEETISAIPLAPGSLGAQILVTLSQRMTNLAQTMVTAAEALSDVPSLVDWVKRTAADPGQRRNLADIAVKLLAVLGLGILAEQIVIRLLRGPRRRLLVHDPAAPPLRLGVKLRLALVDFILDVIPVIAFALVSYGLITVVERWPSRQVALLAANNAYLATRIVRALGRLVFSPDAPSIRLLPMSDETAAYSQIWLQRIMAVGVTGYALTEAGVVFGLDARSHEALNRGLGLLITVFLIMIVLQNRDPVAAMIRAKPDKSGAWALVRNRLADVWHILVILYLVAAWFVTALAIADGYGKIVRFTVSTIVVVALARLIEAALLRAVQRLFALEPDTKRRNPGLEARANRYVPILRGVIAGVIWMIALIVLMQIWGLGAFDWFRAGELGNRIVGALASLGFSLLLALLVWESVNAGINRHLASLQRDSQVARSARLRTLLPLLRTALLVVILVIEALVVLSEIGVNIAPLLAGAGVIGLAIGFGSQKLVQDIITGIFLLVDDAMAVGDVVNLGGQGGVVEAMSIRSIRLRSLDGTVHIIPFSSVTTVSNMTKDFAFAVFDVGVGYGEDADRVMDVLRALAEEMRTEDRWTAVIREKLEMLGLERFGDSAVVIRCRFRTNAGAQWGVSREFNRRMKKRFDELGIEMPFPSRTVVMKMEEAAGAPSEAQQRAAAAAAS